MFAVAKTGIINFNLRSRKIQSQINYIENAIAWRNGRRSFQRPFSNVVAQVDVSLLVAQNQCI